MGLQAFQILGNSNTFTAANPAPTPVQVKSTDGVGCCNYVVTNTGTVDISVGVGPDAATATANAIVPNGTTPSRVLMARTPMIVTGPPNAYFTGFPLLGSGSAVVYVEPGDGQ